jgi:hypothetical protein
MKKAAEERFKKTRKDREEHIREKSLKERCGRKYEGRSNKYK